jgi:hypothetical protein
VYSVNCLEEKKNTYDFFTEDLKRRDHVADLDMLGNIILNCVFDK